MPNGAAAVLWANEIPEDAEPAELVRVVDADTIAASVAGRVEDMLLIQWLSFKSVGYLGLIVPQI